MVNATQFSVKVMPSIQSITASDWDALSDGSPLLSHAFFSALENSQSVGPDTGWNAYPLAIYTEDEKLVGAMPLYLKTHSYGEYVFDWAWADAYDRNGIRYYPKLVSAIPFSPITSKRLLSQHV
ncbi:MAG: peptidogalycan biosysnthesis protein, partial [Methylophilus sp.]